jgi:hypothetical protein
MRGLNMVMVMLVRVKDVHNGRQYTNTAMIWQGAKSCQEQKVVTFLNIS